MKYTYRLVASRAYTLTTSQIEELRRQTRDLIAGSDKIDSFVIETSEDSTAIQFTTNATEFVRDGRKSASGVGQAMRIGGVSLKVVSIRAED